ncbi:uncharacterized protein LOC129011673 isoform X2 [Pongo pygmaeus]|uniref:uncharacterized protein LOC129011673 isoform X2 n=1 Tax=Pongo pygmaeus TaxID=9600 RepID=UPI0023E21023|nr:uncharacterized protein LOC129011673 isoform X2 [Pongo pygmaeus]
MAFSKELAAGPTTSPCCAARTRAEESVGRSMCRRSPEYPQPLVLCTPSLPCSEKGHVTGSHGTQVTAAPPRPQSSSSLRLLEALCPPAHTARYMGWRCCCQSQSLGDMPGCATSRTRVDGIKLLRLGAFLSPSTVSLAFAGTQR